MDAKSYKINPCNQGMKTNSRHINDLLENYEIDLEKIEKEIKSSKAKTILLQFPDGLKPYATSVADYFQGKFPKLQFMIWLGSCFGACDIPQVSHLKPKIDLIIQFGHSKWKTEK
jgi:2-(3-amino-3-carboxypropyl)histidine synthase